MHVLFHISLIIELYANIYLIKLMDLLGREVASGCIGYGNEFNTIKRDKVSPHVRDKQDEIYLMAL